MKARLTICKEVLSFLSQFFQRRRHLSSQAKQRSTIQRFGKTLKLCSSLRLTTSTSASIRSFTPSANFSPVYPPSAMTFKTFERFCRLQQIMQRAPLRSVRLLCLQTWHVASHQYLRRCEALFQKFFSRVIALMLCGVRIFHTPRINNDHCSLLVSTMIYSLFFDKLA